MGNFDTSLRFYSLAKPFSVVRPSAVVDELMRLADVDTPTLRISWGSEKRSRAVKSLDDLGELKWVDPLTISGISNDAEMSIRIRKFQRREGAKSLAEQAQYQAHEFSLDFTRRCQSLDTDSETRKLRRLISLAQIGACEIGVMCSNAPGVLRELYRERGMTEGIPGVFEYMVFGPNFTRLIDLKSAHDRLGPFCIVDNEFSAFAFGRTEEFASGDVNLIKETLGADLFAQPRVISGERSGVFGPTEVLRLLMGARSVDREAVRRVAKRVPNFDWSGLF